MGEMGNAYTSSVEKAEDKVLIRRPMHRPEENILINILKNSFVTCGLD
jgi:hypothetical protein